MARAGWLVFPFLSATLACAATPLKPPEAGGPAWWLVRAPHVELRTDLDPSEAKAWAERIAGLRLAMLTAAWGASGESTRPLQLVLFRSLREFRALASGSTLHAISYSNYQLVTIAGFVSADVTGAPVLVSSADMLELEQDPLLGFIASSIVDPFTRPLPGWLAYGTRTWLTRGRFDAANVSFGRLSHTDTAAGLYSPCARNEADGRLVVTGVAAHDLAVHHLRGLNPQGVLRFVEALQAGRSEATALAEAFPGLTGAALDADLHDLRRHPRDHLVSFAIPQVVAPPPVALSPAEVHATWAQAFLGGPAQRRAAGLAERDRALALEPENVTARLLSLPQGAERAASLRALAETAPEDRRVRLALLEVRDLPAAERLEIADRLLAAAGPDLVRLQLLRAHALLELRRGAEARAALDFVLAVRRSALALHLLALAFSSESRCAEAEAAEAEAELADARLGVAPNLATRKAVMQACADRSK